MRVSSRERVNANLFHEGTAHIFLRSVAEALILFNRNAVVKAKTQADHFRYVRASSR